MLSQAEENYIKAIYHLSGDTEESASTNALSDSLKMKPASISDMLKKLATKNLIHYEKYRGVSLTESGLKEALKIVRKHRLWEVFLVEKLDFSWDEVHDIAEQLEHIQSPMLTNRLDKFLGYPKVDPHGDPIPSADGELHITHQLPLNTVEKNKTHIVVGVKDSSTSFLKYLNKIGIGLGVKIKVLEEIEYDHSLEVEIEKKSHIISKEAAQNIFTSTND